MKLDKIRFAKLLAHCVSNGMTSGDWEIERLDELTEVNVPEPTPVRVNSEDIDRLLMLMLQGTQKIEAIKAYRMMTGMGLKESKDAVERYWVSKPTKGNLANKLMSCFLCTEDKAYEVAEQILGM